MLERPTEALISLLQKCRQGKDVHHAKRLHAYMREHHLDAHPVLGNYLIGMLADCGSLADAHQAFDNLPHRNEHSWTSLISACIRCGEFDHAFHLYLRMQEENLVEPNRVTYLALLRACTRLGDGERGRSLHVDITTRGLDKDLCLSSTLLDTYVKCSFLLEARRVFDGLPTRDSVSWNVLITGYSEHGFSEEVLSCFKQMQLEGLTADDVTLTCSLKACGDKGAFETGRHIHDETTKRGLESKLYVGSTLMDMYIKWGLLEEAWHVFEQLPITNVVPWNTLIAGYVGFGLDEDANNCFQRMQLEGISPDSATFVCSLKGCATLVDLKRCQKLHIEATKRGWDIELHVGSTLMDVYRKCGSLPEAQQTFVRLPVCNAISWTTLIAGYSKQGLDEEVLSSYKQMQVESVAVDADTLILCLKSCGSLKCLGTGQAIHADISKRGMDRNVRVGSVLVSMYGKCGLLAEAQQLFNILPLQNAISWTALITAYAAHGLSAEVLNCFKQMQLQGLITDAITIALCLRACGSVGALQIGREIHAEVRTSGLESDPLVADLLIDMYGKCGCIMEGQEVFDKLLARDVVIWTTMINAYGENHEGVLAVQCFEEMQQQGVKPDSATFTCLLAACSHTSLVLKGQEYFSAMWKYEIEPTLEHYACMVDLFARSGQIFESERFLAAMQCPPSKEILINLLSACKIYGKWELGERCFQQLVEANQEDATACLLMADIYSSAGRWSDAWRVEEMRKDTGRRKEPGRALLEAKTQVHEFVVGSSHNKDIPEMLEALSSCLKDAGYVPDAELLFRHGSDEGGEFGLMIVCQ